MKKSYGLAITVAACVGAACQTQFEVPQEAQISCRSDADCLAGYVCRQNINRCVTPNGDDQPPLVEGTATLSRSLASVGSEIRIEFDSNEILGTAPRVRLGTPELAEFELLSQNGNHYIFRYTVAAGLSGGAWPILASLVDQNGLASKDLTLATLTLDFSAPTVIATSVAYHPDAQNPLNTVGALRNGSRILVSFTTSEPVVVDSLSSQPRVLALCGGGQWELTRLPGESATTVFNYEYTMQAANAVPDGVCSLQSDLVDFAGNVSDNLQLGNLLVDRTAPNASLAILIDRLRHLRVPWGAELSSGLPGQFLVRDVSGASSLTSLGFEADTFFQSGEILSQLRAYTTAQKNVLIGVGSPSAGAWPALALNYIDSPEIWLAVVDHAGNESQALRVYHGEWIASMGGKVPDSFVENPHQLQTNPDFGGMQFVSSGMSAPLNPFGGVEAGTTATTKAAGSWERTATTTATLSNVTDAAMAYDSNRNRLVLFGGLQADVGSYEAHNETYELAPSGWERRLVVGPSPRFGHAMAYDSRSGVVWLVGGDTTGPDCGSGTQWCDDTWTWDGTRWQTMSLGDFVPRVDTMLAYDSRRDSLVLFGGRYQVGTINGQCADGSSAESFDCSLGDTFEWDGSGWTQRVIPGPSARYGAAMAFHPELGEVLLFGGFSNSDNCNADIEFHCQDTWSFNGQRWLLLDNNNAGDNNGILGRELPRMSYDSGQRAMILIAGESDNSGNAAASISHWNVAAKKWVLDHASSTNECGSQPCPGIGFAQAFHSGIGQTIVANGCPSGDNCDNGGMPASLGWDRSTWSELSNGGGSGPSLRALGALAYDPIRGEAVAFGGCSFGAGNGCAANGAIENGETWGWSGHAWEQKAPAAFPPARYNHVLAFDYRNNNMLLFGGQAEVSTSTGPCGDGSNAVAFKCFYGDTWTWNGSNWSNAAAVVATLARRSSTALAFDPVGRGVLLYGGIVASALRSDTWAWTTAWAQKTVVGSTPGPRAQHAMATDWNNDTVVLFGGVGNSSCHLSGPGNPSTCNDTWLWNGTDWTQVATSGSLPAPRTGHSLVYDSTRRRVLLFGGQVDYPDICPGSYGSECDDLWEFNGSSWQKLVPSDKSGVGLPSPRFGVAAAYQEKTRNMVVFGGFDAGGYADDVWQWNASARDVPAHIMRASFSAAHTEAATEIKGLDLSWRGTIVGQQSSATRLAYRNEVGTSLIKTYTPVLVPALSELNGRYLDAQWNLVVHDHVSGSTTTINSWCLDPAPSVMGGPYCNGSSVGVPDRGVASSIINLSGQTLPNLSGLRVSVNISNSVSVSHLEIELKSTRATNAGTLHLWQANSWTPLQNQSGASLHFTWSTQDPAIIAETMTGTRKLIHTALTPAQPNDSIFSTVHTDASESRVLYELPH